MTLTETLAALAAASSSDTHPLPDGWMQGRTLYGGAGALLAYTVARREMPDLPPLRAAQVCFTAPVDGDFTCTAEPLREGRNVTQVQTSLATGGREAARGTWWFGASHDANAVHAAERLTIERGPEDSDPLTDSSHVPDFVSRFDIRKGFGTSGRIAVRRWVRAKDRAALDTAGELVLLGDALPPGSMKAMQRPGPLSSMNWAFNILEPEPQTEDGWWLIETASIHAGDGYSSERLSLWNSEGKLAMTGLQSVAIFG